MTDDIVSIVKPFQGLRYVQVRRKADRYRIMVPIPEEMWGGVEHTIANARRYLAGIPLQPGKRHD